MRDPKLTRAYNQIARKLESVLKNRAPVGETGRLKAGVSVKVSNDGIDIETFDYGMWLHLGTGQEASGLTFEQAIGKTYNPNPGVGDGGIKPRYWMSFGQSIWKQTLDEIEAAEGAAIAQIMAARFSSEIRGNDTAKVKMKN
jgi:hypothetical protein